MTSNNPFAERSIAALTNQIQNISLSNKLLPANAAPLITPTNGTKGKLISSKGFVQPKLGQTLNPNNSQHLFGQE